MKSQIFNQSNLALLYSVIVMLSVMSVAKLGSTTWPMVTLREGNSTTPASEYDTYDFYFGMVCKSMTRDMEMNTGEMKSTCGSHANLGWEDERLSYLAGFLEGRFETELMIMYAMLVIIGLLNFLFILTSLTARFLSPSRALRFLKASIVFFVLSLHALDIILGLVLMIISMDLCWSKIVSLNLFWINIQSYFLAPCYLLFTMHRWSKGNYMKAKRSKEYAPDFLEVKKRTERGEKAGNNLS